MEGNSGKKSHNKMKMKKSQKNKWGQRLEKDDCHGAMRGEIGIKMTNIPQWEIRKIDCKISTILYIVYRFKESPSNIKLENPL